MTSEAFCASQRQPADAHSSSHPITGVCQDDARLSRLDGVEVFEGKEDGENVEGRLPRRLAHTILADWDLDGLSRTLWSEIFERDKSERDEGPAGKVRASAGRHLDRARDSGLTTSTPISSTPCSLASFVCLSRTHLVRDWLDTRARRLMGLRTVLL